MKVVVAQPIAEEGLRLLREHDYTVTQLDDHSVPSLKAAAADADALLVRDAFVPAEVISAAPRLKVIARHGVGTERIDLQAAKNHAVVVTNTPLANSLAVAEHTLALILALAKRIVHIDKENRAGHFDIRHTCLGTELEGKVLGVLGLGNVGRLVAKKAAAGLGMQVVGYDPYVSAENIGDAVRLAEDWRAVLQEADVLTLHLPLTEATRGMIDLDAFRSMKRSALFINCARGPLVVEMDLVHVLREGLIAGAALDVYDPDPPVPDNPLFDMVNVIVTPHTAAHTQEAMRRMALHAAQGVIEVLSGACPTWPVVLPAAGRFDRAERQEGPRRL